MPRSSVDSLQDPPPDVPGLSGTDSTPRLILLPDTDDHDPLQEYPTDGDDDNLDEDGDSQSAQPLSPSVVFLHLLSPYLRLGAICAFDVRDASLAYALAALIVAASLSAFCRHIWFLLGRYVRRSSTEDVLLHSFARGHRRVRKDGWARCLIAILSGSFKILLAAMYLRNSVDSALLLRVPDWIPSPSRLNISILLSIFAFVLSLPRSLASKTITRTTILSIASYLAWLVAVSGAYGANKLGLISFGRGLLWNEISSLTFACTTAMTVPLSASLIAGTPLVPPASRNVRRRSFEALNIFSIVLAVLLLLPLVIMAAPHRAPAARATSDDLVLALRIATLSLSIPSVIVSIISLPLHGVVQRDIRTDLVLSGIVVAIFSLSLVPPSVASILDDVTLFLAVSGTFLLPALAHITIHHFRRPLSIVVSHAPPSALTTSHPSSGERSPSPSRDQLLQRKEWLLQRSRLGKRLFWDIVVWGVLLPVCGCAFTWAAGRIARQW